MDYISIMLEKLGEPSSKENLENYVNFVIDNAKKIKTQYTEQHHLLPKSQFKEHEKDENNIFELDYEDHVKAHQLLCEAYPISSFSRPLNFMLNRIEKGDEQYREVLSESRRKDWEKFKKTEKYNEWRIKKSKETSKRMKSGLAKEMSDKFYSTDGVREEISKRVKTLWENEEWREKTIRSMVAERNTPEAKLRYENAIKKRWENCSEEDKQKFIEKMTIVNQSEEKNKKASDTMKANWEDPEFREKMKKRKTRGSDGSKLKEKWQDPEFRAKMLAARKKGKNETKQD